MALGILRLSPIPVRFPYPFWRLQNDGIWKLQGAESLAKRKGHSDAKKSELLKHDVSGGFTAEVRQALANDDELPRDIVQDTLDANFPETLHTDILDAVGLDLSVQPDHRRARSPEFRLIAATLSLYVPVLPALR